MKMLVGVGRCGLGFELGFEWWFEIELWFRFGFGFAVTLGGVWFEQFWIPVDKITYHVVNYCLCTHQAVIVKSDDDFVLRYACTSSHMGGVGYCGNEDFPMREFPTVKNTTQRAKTTTSHRTPYTISRPGTVSEKSEFVFSYQSATANRYELRGRRITQHMRTIYVTRQESNKIGPSLLNNYYSPYFH